MSQGGGNFFKNAGDDLLGGLVHAATGGLVSVGNGRNFWSKAGSEYNFNLRTGKGQKGFALHAVDEGWGEVSGRNFKRKQLNIEGDKINAAKEEADRQKKFELDKKEQLTRQASFTAGAQLQTAFNGSVLPKSSAVGDPEKDFLGL